MQISDGAAQLKIYAIVCGWLWVAAERAKESAPSLHALRPTSVCAFARYIGAHKVESTLAKPLVEVGVSTTRLARNGHMVEGSLCKE